MAQRELFTPRRALGSPATASGPELPLVSAEECLHYTLTADPDVALLGMSFPNEQDAAFAAAASFRPLLPEEMTAVRLRAAAALRDKGPQWWNPIPFTAGQSGGRGE